jgi:hypothetical protein
MSGFNSAYAHIHMCTADDQLARFCRRAFMVNKVLHTMVIKIADTPQAGRACQGSCSSAVANQLN